MFAFMGHRLSHSGFSLYGMGSVKKTSQDVILSSLTKQHVLMVCAIKRGQKSGQKVVKKGSFFSSWGGVKSAEIARSTLCKSAHRLPVSDQERGAFARVFGKNFSHHLLIYCLVYTPT
jgi:hypothetical protein